LAFYGQLFDSHGKMGQRERVAKGPGNQGLNFLAARQVSIMAGFSMFSIFCL
jgi:hypothetical protein